MSCSVIIPVVGSSGPIQVDLYVMLCYHSCYWLLGTYCGGIQCNTIQYDLLCIQLVLVARFLITSFLSFC